MIVAGVLSAIAPAILQTKSNKQHKYKQWRGIVLQLSYIGFTITDVPATTVSKIAENG